MKTHQRSLFSLFICVALAGGAAGCAGGVDGPDGPATAEGAPAEGGGAAEGGGTFAVDGAGTEFGEVEATSSRDESEAASGSSLLWCRPRKCYFNTGGLLCCFDTFTCTWDCA
jgi:hypothetical protein